MPTDDLPTCDGLSLNIRKRTFGHVFPARIQISLRIRAPSLDTFGITKDVKVLHADNEDTNQPARYAFVQADVSLHWAQMSESTLRLEC